jgi:hypothetical protein
VASQFCCSILPSLDSPSLNFCHLWIIRHHRRELSIFTHGANRQDLLLKNTALPIVRDLLLRNKTLTSFDLSSLYPKDDDLVHVIREGLLVSQGHLQRLGLKFTHLGSELSQQLQSIYDESNHEEHLTANPVDGSNNNMRNNNSKENK